MTDLPSPLADASQSEALRLLSEALPHLYAVDRRSWCMCDITVPGSPHDPDCKWVADVEDVGALRIAIIDYVGARSSEPAASPAPASPDEPSTAIERRIVPHGPNGECSNPDLCSDLIDLRVAIEREARAASLGASASVPPSLDYDWGAKVMHATRRGIVAHPADPSDCTCREDTANLAAAYAAETPE